MNCFIKILLVTGFVFCATAIFAQDRQRYNTYDGVLEIKKVNIKYSPYFFSPVIGNEKFEKKITSKKNIDLSPIYFKIDDLATFCKLELKLEKAVNMPIKFRLGEVQYVERLEGKH